MQPAECECDFTYSDVCSKCSIELILDVTNTNEADGDAIKVTTQDLKVRQRLAMNVGGITVDLRKHCSAALGSPQRWLSFPAPPRRRPACSLCRQKLRRALRLHIL